MTDIFGAIQNLQKMIVQQNDEVRMLSRKVDLMDSSQHHSKDPLNRNFGGAIPMQSFKTPKKDLSKIAPPFSSGSGQRQDLFLSPTSVGIQGSHTMPSSRSDSKNYPMGNAFLNNYNTTTSAMQADMAGSLDPRDEEIRLLREMISKIPGAPEPIEKVSDTLYAETPFSDDIAGMELPDNFKVPNMKLYDGKDDPRQHVAHYRQRMMYKPIPKQFKEACICKGFSSSLKGPALDWYVNLPSGSVNSFADLITKFNTQFATSRKLEKKTSDLFRVIKRHGETLKEFLIRFNVELLQVNNPD